MFGSDPGTFWAVLAALFMFGTLYSCIVVKLGRMKEGFQSLFVVVGVLVTLAGVAVISLNAALLTGITFIASGVPMIIGDIARYIYLREREKRSLLEKNDHTA